MNERKRKKKCQTNKYRAIISMMVVIHTIDCLQSMKKNGHNHDLPDIIIIIIKVIRWKNSWPIFCFFGDDDNIGVFLSLVITNQQVILSLTFFKKFKKTFIRWSVHVTNQKKKNDDIFMIKIESRWCFLMTLSSFVSINHTDDDLLIRIKLFFENYLY